jgi:hypothetical protein
MTISPDNLVKLPLHDARLIALAIDSTKEGAISLNLKVEVNLEGLSGLQDFGLTKPVLLLIFDNCWQIKTNIWGYSMAQESISSLRIDQNSELKQKLFSSGMGDNNIIHFKIEGSQGSCLDILATEVSIKE